MNEAGHTQGDALAEPPEVHERNLWIGARILAGATIMFFLAFVFAYFYLRSLNSAGKWNALGVKAPDGYGAAIVALFVVSAASFAYAAHAARNGRRWLAAAGLALVLGLAGCVVQGFEWANLGFGPTKGGFASVFIGWTLLFVVFVLLAMYWVEIVLAEGIRNRSDPRPSVPAGFADVAFYWGLVAVIGVIAWAILYLV